METLKGKQKRPIKGVIYGAPAVGKSTFCAQFKNALFLDVEGGVHNIDCEKTPRLDTLGLVDEALKLAENPEYKTVVIDSLDWLERLIQFQVAKDAKKTDVASIGYGVGYKQSAVKFIEYLDKLDRLVESGKNIFFTAHSAVKVFRDPQIETEYNYYSIDCHDQVVSAAREWADVIFFMDFSKVEKSGEKGKRGRVLSSGDRVIYTESRPSHLAKNRFSLPVEMEADFKSIMQLIAKNRE